MHLKKRSSHFVYSLGILLGTLLSGLAGGFVGRASVAPTGDGPSSQLQSSSLPVRVRVAHGLTQVKLKAKPLKITVSVPEVLGSLPLSMNQVTLVCRAGEVIVKGRKNGNLGSFVEVRGPASGVSFQKGSYRSVLRVHAVGNRCDVVNELDLERYLVGLLNSEVSSSWGQQALFAQSVAARTYAYFKILAAKKGRHFDLESTVSDQVYLGTQFEDQACVQAVRGTRGLVLTQNAGTHAVPIQAFYHSSCGGQTETPDHVWGGGSQGVHRSVSCGYCSGSPVFRWHLEMSSDTLAKLILKGAQSYSKAARWPIGWQQVVETGELLKIDTQGNLTRDRKSPHVGGRSDIGMPSYLRVGHVVMVWGPGASCSGCKAVSLSVPGPRFRDWMGNTRFRSTAFEVTSTIHGNQRSQKLWNFKGVGNGHGVGLCQWGAKYMAEKGKDMRQILSLYYPAASLKKLW